MKLNAIPYYLSSIPTLLTTTSWWQIPVTVLTGRALLKLNNDLEFHVANLMDIWTIKEVIIDDCYKMKQNIHSGATVIDIGGSIGDFAVTCEKKYKAKHVYSFEPDSNRIELYKKNVRRNECSKVTLFEEPALSLDEVFTKTKIKSCEYMKVDCEGGEYPIFDKASDKTLQKIQFIAFEVHFFSEQMKQQYPKLMQKLAKNGFVLTQQANPVHTTIGFLFAERKK